MPAALDESGAFVHEGFDLLRRARLHVDARAERARRRRRDPRRGLRRPGHAGPRLSRHLARPLDAHAPRRRPGLAAPPRPARSGPREGRRQAARARVDRARRTGSSRTARPRRSRAGSACRGRKAPASGAPAGDILVTSIRWEDAPDGPQVIHAAVPFAADGVQHRGDVGRHRDAGHRLAHRRARRRRSCPTTRSALIRPAGDWHPVWSTVLGAAMPLIMSSYVGVADAAAERAVALAGSSGHPPRCRPGRRSDAQPAHGREGHVCGR